MRSLIPVKTRLLGEVFLAPSTDAAISDQRSAFAVFRFPAEVITVSVRWYLRYGLSYRDLEELLAERGGAALAQRAEHELAAIAPRVVTASGPAEAVEGALRTSLVAVRDEVFGSTVDEAAA